MMWEDLWRALCLVVILEGILPFLYPRRWRNLAAQMAGISDSQLRITGLIMMLIGLFFLSLIH